MGNRGKVSDPIPARRLGNRALKLGIGLLILARIHDDSLAALKAGQSSSKINDRQAKRSTAFFNSALEPVEESRFAVSEANSRLEANVKTLTIRTEALDRLNKELHAEISRREAVEKSLRTSEKTSSLLLKQAHEMQKQMRSLSRRIITAEESERKRISRELHDVVAQTLTGISLRLAVLRSQNAANAKEYHDKIETTERLVEQSVEIVHRFATDLRPVVLDDIGLIPALKSLIDSFSETYEVPVKLIAPPSINKLNGNSLITFFRIAQEALINTARHSGASLVIIHLSSTTKSFQMKISDNGKGFTSDDIEQASQENRVGLLGMRERAEMMGGTLQIDSIVDEGTVVKVVIPRPENSLQENSQTKVGRQGDKKKNK